VLLAQICLDLKLQAYFVLGCDCPSCFALGLPCPPSCFVLGLCSDVPAQAIFRLDAPTQVFFALDVPAQLV
jgi:hypothetical protein